MQQQQQHADYDLLAVFSDESKAEAAAAKLRKEGFTEEEVHHLPAGQVGSGVFREHGPNRNRSEYFLQTKRSGPRPQIVVLFAVIFGLVLAGLLFVSSFAFPAILPEPTSAVIGGAVGIVLGAIIGLLQRGRVRGSIGQQSKGSPPVSSHSSEVSKTVVALRLPDADNISRKSRARAILLNNGGKIDRSVGRRE